MTHWYQKFTFHSILSFQKLLICRSWNLLIRCSKTEFFLQNTNNADRIGVNIHNTNTKTKHSEKDTASLKRVSMKMGERVGV